MQTVNLLLETANTALRKYNYYTKLEILNQGSRYVKFRLYVNKNLFIQVNRNEAPELKNFVQIKEFRRIFARDEYKGNWHRHSVSDPDDHNIIAMKGRSQLLWMSFC